jgi:hypothetical protein
MRRLKRWLLPLISLFMFGSMTLGWVQRMRSARPRPAVAAPAEGGPRR